MWTGSTADRFSAVGWEAGKVQWHEVVMASRSRCQFAEVARVIELVEMEQLPRGEGSRPTKDRGSFPEPVVEERSVHFRVEREELMTVVRLLVGPCQQVSIESDGTRLRIRPS